jgi:ABC-type phosphate transport system substrate-binding protein
MPRRTLLVFVALLTVVGLPVVLPRVQAEAAIPFKVIVHLGVKGTSVSRDVVAQVFLGRVERWGDGTHITPFDLSTASPVRSAFSEALLGMPIAGVRDYWVKRLLAGGRPPMVKGSEEEMIAAVAASPGAIGYVSESTALPETVKILRLQ